MLSCSFEFRHLTLGRVVCGDIGLLSRRDTPTTPNVERAGVNAMTDDSLFFAGPGALSTWAVMGMTDSREFQSYARLDARASSSASSHEEIFRAARRRLRAMRICGIARHECRKLALLPLSLSRLNLTHLEEERTE